MNTKEIYRQATTPDSVLEEQKAKKEKLNEEKHFASSLDFQNYQEWLNNPRTQEVLANLHVVQLQLFNLAMLAAIQNDTVKSTQLLIQSDTIERITSYVRTKTPIY